MTEKGSQNKKCIYTAAAVAFWLLVWQVLAVAVASRVILPGPWDTFLALIRLITELSFWQTVGNSFLHIVAGFLCAVVLGTALAVLSHQFRIVNVLVSPLMRLIKAVPVASFIILVLLWINSRQLPFVISTLMVLPVIYINVLTGIESTDPKLLEMAEVFRLSRGRKLRFIYIPAVRPSFIAAVNIGLGFCWKSGIAAEVIGLSPKAIGTMLYESKLYLLTDELFAWTVVIVAVSVAFEKLVMRLLKMLSGKCSVMKYKDGFRTGTGSVNVPKDIVFGNVGKKYGNTVVFRNYSEIFGAGRSTAIMGPSGVGKTTVIRLMTGLEKPDRGEVTDSTRNTFACVFQEDRLLEYCSAMQNIRLVLPGNVPESAVIAELKAVGIGDNEDELTKPVSQFSGGMKRRVAIVRALMAEADTVILDEPFKGLDEDMKQRVIGYVEDRIGTSGLILVTHEKDEAEALCDRIVVLHQPSE